MKSPYFILPFVFAGVAASAVAAQTDKPVTESTKPVTQWTCAEFNAIDEQFRPKVVYWSMAYAKVGKPGAGEIDIAGTEKIIPMVIEECEKAPQESFWQKLKAAWHKVKAEAKATAGKL